MANHYVMPLGILYVSAYVKRAEVANVYTLNLNHVEGEEYEILNSYITGYQINVVGVGGLSGEYIDISRMVRLVKCINQEIYVVVGGGIMTADPETTMKAIPDVDFGVIGEGELTMAELLVALGTGDHVEQVDGLIIRKGKRLLMTRKRIEIVDLDSLPFPDYEGFNYREYLKNNPDISDEGKKYSQVSVIGGRSCKYNCTFCFHPSGTTYRQRSLDSIFAEINYLVEHYDISYIALREELFATDNRRVADFCRRMEKYDFDWSIQLRIDSINKELVDLLKGTRCRYVFVGVESADNEVLKSMRKGITLEQIEKALDMLSDAGLNTRSGIIFGDTAETYDTAMFTLDWFRKNCNRYRMFVDMIIAFPGSVLYKRACRSGIIPDPVKFLQDGCPIVNVSRMDNRQFTDLVHQIEKMNYRKYNVKYYNESL
ncbi:radical SAM protein [Phocaeicola plebeius]|uniref:B12-binding domain-containing radical SAM protein n=1 Tax=Phocaeicola plebeius TaxID=310297 RepID=UPI001958FC17|nr:radical SAM protein [Phocaeicola plebeius]MBM6964865.1 radical SAM protein [Phocaeicola plebeius]